MSDSILIGLVEFSCGTDVRRFCTRNEDFLWGGHIWYAHPIRHGDIEQTSEITKNDLQFEFPLTDEFAQSHLGYGPDEVTVVKLYRNAIDDPDEFEIFWIGRVASADANDTTITLLCESIFTTLKVIGLHERMQKFCRWVVYHDGCWLDKADFAYISNVTAVDTRRTMLTCPAAASKPDGYFTGGIIEMPGGALRYISKHVGDKIHLWRPAHEIVAALAVGPVFLSLFPGCDGSLAMCNDRFNNLDNNGAFYWIPDINPNSGAKIF
jgi:uncharacterized phage protein (TIGR02218 family)